MTYRSYGSSYVDYSKYQDIDLQPIPSDEYINRDLYISDAALKPRVHSAIYQGGAIYHMWLHLGRRQGGASALTSTYDILKARRNVGLGVLEKHAKYDYTARRTIETISPTRIYASLAPELVEQRKSYCEIINNSTVNVVEAHIGDKRSKYNQLDLRFTLVFEATQSKEKRYHYFFRHVSKRIRWPIAEEWMPHLWGWMRSVDAISPLNSFGLYIGWYVNLNEHEIRKFISRELKAGRIHFPSATPVSSHQQYIEAPATHLIAA